MQAVILPLLRRPPMTDASVQPHPRSASGFDLTPPTADQLKGLEASLSPEEARVLLKHGTEAPFCGGLLGEKAPGAYVCRLCGLPLFRSHAKFESGTGWPSFYAPFDPETSGRCATSATAWSGSRPAAPAATATRAMCSPTARRRPATATASTPCRWSSPRRPPPCPTSSTRRAGGAAPGLVPADGQQVERRMVGRCVSARLSERPQVRPARRSRSRVAGKRRDNGTWMSPSAPACNPPNRWPPGCAGGRD